MNRDKQSQLTKIIGLEEIDVLYLIDIIEYDVSKAEEGIKAAKSVKSDEIRKAFMESEKERIRIGKSILGILKN